MTFDVMFRTFDKNKAKMFENGFNKGFAAMASFIAAFCENQIDGNFFFNNFSAKNIDLLYNQTSVVDTHQNYYLS